MQPRPRDRVHPRLLQNKHLPFPGLLQSFRIQGRDIRSSHCEATGAEKEEESRAGSDAVARKKLHSSSSSSFRCTTATVQPGGKMLRSTSYRTCRFTTDFSNDCESSWNDQLIE